MRPDRDAWHLDGADWLARMGDCTRSGVGALIVGPDKRIWGMGYNGSFPGGPSCLEGACPRGRHYDAGPCECRCLCEEGPHCHCDGFGYVGKHNRCGCFERWPCGQAVAPGSSYDTGPGACIATHAEGNAKADALRRGGGDLSGCHMVVSREPCDGCVRDLRNTTRMTAILWRQGAIGLP